jgi:hypothetical protein
MNLGFDHPAIPAERLCHLARFLGRGRDIPSGDRYIVGVYDLFTLIFVDFHT